MVLTSAGEDDILYCESCEFCVNLEIAKVNEGDSCPKCTKSLLQKARASEAGNVFDLGIKYGKDFDLTFIDKNGEKQYPIMGCYGIGISRAMGIIVEKYHDERGIVWPESVAPFAAHLVVLQNQDLGIKNQADELYKKLTEAGIEVLYDDRDVSAGQKFADADLIGIPVRLVVSPKTDGKVELKKRNEKETILMTIDEIINKYL